MVAFSSDPRLGWFQEHGALRAPRNWIWLLDLWLMYPGHDSAAAAAADSLRAWVATGRMSRLPRAGSWVSYDSDVQLALQLMEEAARGEPRALGTSTGPKAFVARLGDAGIELELGVWIGNGNSWGEPIPIARAGEHIAGLEQGGQFAR